MNHSRPDDAVMKFPLFIALIGFLAVGHAHPDAPKWAKIKTPTTSKASESIGKYHAGCVRGAATLPINGQGYQVMRLSRNRFYGHPDLIDFIENLGRTAQNQKLGTLLIGDLGQPRGGPTLSGHKSHQTGLDVDIWYQLSQKAGQRELSKSERESMGAPSVLTSSADGINHKEWTFANEKILEAAARAPEVDRIFVNAVIKKELCGHAGSHDWLQKIRPWFAHADHFHVRLKCPSGSRYCEKQEPIPNGDGCGSDLAWWFSYEAKHPEKKPPVPPPPLPSECNAVLYE